MHDRFDDIEAWVIDKLPFIALFIVILVAIVVSSIDSQKWNHGVCPKCGVNYEFAGYVGHRFNTWCMYECPECGNTVEIGMKEHKAYKERRKQ